MHMQGTQWHKISEQLPPDGAWCWVWHTDWDTQRVAPQHVQYKRHGACSRWWIDVRYEVGYFDDQQLTHWAPLSAPVPPSQGGYVQQLFVHERAGLWPLG